MAILVNKSQSTINRCLRTALLVDPFWERWLVHGLENDDLTSIRHSVKSTDEWVNSWSQLAEEKVRKAKHLLEVGTIKAAQAQFFKASLYYNLVQWLFPDPQQPEKLHWYNLCQRYIKEADRLSDVETRYVSIQVDGLPCFGRIRIPMNPIGVIMIINPIDSCKEELAAYEPDFIQHGFATVSFDGPGQGETFIRNNFRANERRQQQFVDRVIDFIQELTVLPIYVFGTSSGASWAVYAGSHSQVSKVVAVSPIDQRPNLFLPSYFNSRLDFILDEYEYLPNYQDLSFKCPVLLYHGAKDGMIHPSFMDNLFKLLPDEKKLVVFEEEGHCCNYRLNEIRKESIDWFKEKSI